jgi:hypothetical protein
MRSFEAFIKHNLVFIIWFDIFGLLWVIYTLGIFQAALPLVIHQHVSNFIYSAYATLILAGPASFRASRKTRLKLAVGLVVIINFALEILPLFSDSFQQLTHRLSNTSDPLDFVAGIAGIGVVSVVCLYYSKNYQS